jgi:hypothetical protein
MTAGFYQEWVWPAGGSGGIWGDLAGGILQLAVVALITYAVYRPLRKVINAWVKGHLHTANDELHRKVDHVLKQNAHIIKHSDHIPNESHDGVSLIEGPPPKESHA